MDNLWSMYNKVEKLRIDDLKTEHVRIILLAVPSRRMADWYACREGDMQWSAISEIPEFYEDVRVLKGLPEESPPPKPATPPARKVDPPRRPLFEEAPSDPTAPIDMATTRVQERRSARRFPRGLQFALKQGGFTCTTRDVSIGGLSLSEPLPKTAGRTFRCTLAHEGTVVDLTCERVTDTKLKVLECESWDVIRKWIVNWNVA